MKKKPQKRSGNSAVDVSSPVTKKKKSKKSKSSDGMLKVATPTDTRLRALKEAGLIVPEEIPSDDETVPLDFTLLSNRDVGTVHSRFSVRHAHALYHVAICASDLVRQRRNLRMAESKFRVMHSGEKKTDVDAAMEDDEGIVKSRNRIASLEARFEILKAVTEGYEDLRNAASREMTRRIGEKAALD